MSRLSHSHCTFRSFSLHDSHPYDPLPSMTSSTGQFSIWGSIWFIKQTSCVGCRGYTTFWSVAASACIQPLWCIASKVSLRINIKSNGGHKQHRAEDMCLSTPTSSHSLSDQSYIHTAAMKFAERKIGKHPHVICRPKLGESTLASVVL